jgi:hypothetical protein
MIWLVVWRALASAMLLMNREDIQAGKTAVFGFWMLIAAAAVFIAHGLLRQ